MAGVEGRTVGEDGSDAPVSGWDNCMVGKGELEWDGMLWKDTTYAMLKKRIAYHIYVVTYVARYLFKIEFWFSYIFFSCVWYSKMR